MTFIYGQLLAKLQKECGYAFALLELISCIRPDNLPLTLLASAYRRLPGRQEQVSSDYAFAVGHAELRRLRILQYEDDDWSLHNLTHRLISEFLQNAKNRATVAILAGFVELIDDMLIGRSLNGVSPSDINQAEWALMSLDNMTMAEAAECRIGRVALAMQKWEEIQGLGDAPLASTRAARLLVHEGALSSKAELAELALTNIDMAELMYALISRCRSRNVSEYARALLSISEVIRNLAAEDDLEHQVWARVLDFDARSALLAPEPSTEGLREALDLARAAGPNHLWLGEIFLRFAASNARAARWDNAAGFSSYAEQNFRKNLENASSTHGLILAQCGLLQATTVLEHPARWGERTRLLKTWKLVFPTFETGKAFLADKTQQLLLGVMSNGLDAADYTAATELIKLFALDTVNRHEWYELRRDWYDSRCTQLDEMGWHEYRTIVEKYYLLRYRAAKGTFSFYDAAVIASELASKTHSNGDLLMSLRFTTLRVKLLVLMAKMHLTQDVASSLLDTLDLVATTASTFHERNIYHEAIVTGHFVVSAVPNESDAQDRRTAADLLRDTAIPLHPYDAFGEGESAVLRWYERVLGGEIGAVGILAF